MESYGELKDKSPLSKGAGYCLLSDLVGGVFLSQYLTVFFFLIYKMLLFFLICYVYFSCWNSLFGNASFYGF